MFKVFLSSSLRKGIKSNIYRVNSKTHTHSTIVVSQTANKQHQQQTRNFSSNQQQTSTSSGSSMFSVRNIVGGIFVAGLSYFTYQTKIKRTHDQSKPIQEHMDKLKKSDPDRWQIKANGDAKLNELMGIDLEKNFTDVRMVFQMDGRIFECTSSTIVTTDSNGFSKETYLFRPVSKNNNNENNKQTTTESIQLDDLRLCGFIPFETMSEKEKSGLSIIFNQPKDGEQSKIQQPIRTAIATRRIDSNNEGRFQIIAETVHSSYLRGARFTYEIKTEKPLTIQQQNEIVNRWLSTLSVGFA